MSESYTASLPAKRVGAGALFFDDTGRVLLVEPVYKGEWEIPGGIVEADESPYEACCREITEELSLTRKPIRLLGIDWVPPLAHRTEGLMFVFDGGELTSEETKAIMLPVTELRSYAFVTLAEAESRLSERMTRRIAACMAVRDKGTVAYLEDGKAIP